MSGLKNTTLALAFILASAGVAHAQTKNDGCGNVKKAPVKRSRAPAKKPEILPQSCTAVPVINNNIAVPSTPPVPVTLVVSPTSAPPAPPPPPRPVAENNPAQPLHTVDTCRERSKLGWLGASYHVFCLDETTATKDITVTVVPGTKDTPAGNLVTANGDISLANLDGFIVQSVTVETKTTKDTRQEVKTGPGVIATLSGVVQAGGVAASGGAAAAGQFKSNVSATATGGSATATGGSATATSSSSSSASASATANSNATNGSSSSAPAVVKPSSGTSAGSSSDPKKDKKETKKDNDGGQASLSSRRPFDGKVNVRVLAKPLAYDVAA